MVKRRASVSSASDTEIAHKAAKKTKTSSGLVSPAGKDDDGNAYWEASCPDITRRVTSTNADPPQLTSKRRVGVSQFKNTCLINIREYYEKDGKMLPGKKVTSPIVSLISFFIKKNCSNNKLILPRASPSLQSSTPLC